MSHQIIQLPPSFISSHFSAVHLSIPHLDEVLRYARVREQRKAGSQCDGHFRPLLRLLHFLGLSAAPKLWESLVGCGDLSAPLLRRLCARPHCCSEVALGPHEGVGPTGQPRAAVLQDVLSVI
jgi:hypothetical protein